MPGGATGKVLRLFGVIVLAAGVSWASGNIARAQTAAPDAGGMDSVLKMLNLKTDVGRAPDFVEASRPKAKPDFISIGTSHPTRPVKVKSAIELKAAEAELDAARVKQDKLAGRTPQESKPVPPPAKPKIRQRAPTQN